MVEQVGTVAASGASLDLSPCVLACLPWLPHAGPGQCFDARYGEAVREEEDQQGGRDPKAAEAKACRCQSPPAAAPAAAAAAAACCCCCLLLLLLRVLVLLLALLVVVVTTSRSERRSIGFIIGRPLPNWLPAAAAAVAAAAVVHDLSRLLLRLSPSSCLRCMLLHIKCHHTPGRMQFDALTLRRSLHSLHWEERRREEQHGRAKQTESFTSRNKLCQASKHWEHRGRLTPTAGTSCARRRSSGRGADGFHGAGTSRMRAPSFGRRPG